MQPDCNTTYIKMPRVKYAKFFIHYVNDNSSFDPTKGTLQDMAIKLKPLYRAAFLMDCGEISF